jgi:sortase A
MTDSIGPAHPPAPGGGRTLAVKAEFLLWIVGLVCLGVAATALVESHVFQSLQSDAFDRARASRKMTTPEERDEKLGFAKAAPATGVLGRIEIPRLGIRAMVKEGVDDETLKVAVGHVPGTALPGEPGNIGLAAHRDTFFRRLRDVRKGDVLTLTTLDGSRSYRVTSTTVVEPDRVDVLARAGGTSRLTLVTCFPFDWVGAAPKRFVVAALASGKAQLGGR